MIAYFTIALNVVSGLLYTPWMIAQLGDSDYGLYTLANSLINLVLFDFGLSAATSRFVAKYLAEGRQDQVNRILGAIYKLYFLIDAVILGVLVVIYFNLSTIYTKLTPMEIDRFKVVFILSAVFALVNFPCVTFTGILNAYEKFVSLKVADALYRIFSVVITVIALLMDGGLYALVAVHVVVGLLTLAFKFLVIKTKTPIKVNFFYKEKGVFRELLGFSVWVTVSTLAQRLVMGVTPSILGMVYNTTAITGFGVVVLIENYIHIITTALNGMFMSRISRIFTQENYVKKLNDLIIKVGRFQLALNGLIVVGLLLLGKDFVSLWLGDGYGVVYYGILLVAVPGLFYYPLQIANTAMVMKNRVKIQAITNLVVGLVNVALAFVLARYYGVLGACISVCTAYNLRNIGYLIAYKKILSLDIKRLCKECYLKLGLPMLITVVMGVGVNYLIPDTTWLTFVVKGIVVVTLYFVLLLFLGLNRGERSQIKTVVLQKLPFGKK